MSLNYQQIEALESQGLDCTDLRKELDKVNDAKDKALKERQTQKRETRNTKLTD